MFLKRVYIRNVRCFKEVDIKLDSPTKDQVSWALILGDNGTGKTTLLRCIAIALCDETSASALVRELPGRLIREGQDEATIELIVEDRHHATHSFRVTIDKTRSGEEEVTTTGDTEVPWDKVFACGYGANRATFSSPPVERFRLVDTVYTLFNYESGLQNPELAVHRVTRLGVPEDEVLRKLDRVLMLPAGSTKLEPQEGGLVVRGPWGKYIPIAALGDGYAVMLALVCDAWSWYLIFSGEQFDLSIKGIVLLDEIEQHLHPAWQRRIVGLLSQTFPEMQFVATTHAPLCAIGSSELRDEECQLVLLEREADSVRSRAGLRPPRGRRADQVLTSFLFGLGTSGDDETKAQVHRFADLASRKRSSAEETEFRRIEQELKQTLGSPETDLERYVQQGVREVLNTAPRPGAFPQKAVDYEILRQIRDLLKE